MSSGLSYDCLTSSRKVTLPSVEDWGTNLNILKEPKKGIFTKKKEKVGDTNKALLEAEKAYDRIEEVINVYPRGVNPMVDISYNNYGSNGSKTTSFKNLNTGTRLPYKEEILRPEIDLNANIPLSRIPYKSQTVKTNPSASKFINEMSLPELKKSVNTTILNPKGHFNKKFIKETPFVFTNDSKKEIHEDILTTNLNVGKMQSTVGTFQSKIEHIDPKFYDTNKTNYSMNIGKKGLYNKNGSFNKNLDNTINENNLTMTVNSSKATSNIQKNIHNTSSRKEAENQKLLPSYYTKKTFCVDKNTFEQKPEKEIRTNIDHYSIYGNKKSAYLKYDRNNSNVQLRDAMNMTVNSNKSKNIYKSGITNSALENIKTKDNIVTSGRTNKTYLSQQKWMNDGPQLEKKTVNVTINTNENKIIDKKTTYDIQDNKYQKVLNNKGSVGSFLPKPTATMKQIEHLDYSKTKKIGSRINLNDFQSRINNM